VLPPDALIDDTDLQVEEEYVSAVRATGAIIRHRSRWLNAVSGIANQQQISVLSLLPFVKEIELLETYGKRRHEPAFDISPVQTDHQQKTDGVHALEYGQSFNQLDQIKVPAVHDLGNHAEGVLVGVFDNGFRLLTHESFASMDIVAMHDFVDHKESVIPSNPSGSFGNHGVNTLSTIGGFKPGKLIGPAYGASFILARTENDSSETPVEEDNWVAAIEWADSIGVQVTSTSLTYLDYNSGYTSWTWEDMDGRTTVISRAAAMAVRKGIIVVNSAGNEGYYSAIHNTLNAPADADSVVAAGAVTLSGARASFSSVGPTTANPPRIKPDVMALGTGVYVASSSDTIGYGSSQGTSFSCPLVAGVAALLRKAAPNASAMAIVNAMKITASNASSPNNQMGWGILNAKAALEHLTGGDTSISPDVPRGFALRQNYPNPFNPGTSIWFEIPGSSTSMVRLIVYDVLGREVAVIVNGPLGPGRHQKQFIASGLATGVYFYRLQVSGGGRDFSEAKRMILMR